MNVDRSNLETLVKPADELVNMLSEKLEKLKIHDFIAKEQFSFLENKKLDLKIGEYIVLGDFAENFTFVIQDAVQSYHWTNTQATIHPFVIYYKNSKNELQHFSFAIISEILEHNTISVHLF